MATEKQERGKEGEERPDKPLALEASCRLHLAQRKREQHKRKSDIFINRNSIHLSPSIDHFIYE